jgi:predicted nucleic acid-binding protein
MDDSRGTLIVRAEATDEVAARSIIYRHADKDFSLTGAISFAIMARLGLSQAFTFDKHFERYGWRVLRN